MSKQISMHINSRIWQDLLALSESQGRQAVELVREGIAELDELPQVEAFGPFDLLTRVRLADVQIERINALAAAARVNQSEGLRRVVEAMLKKYR